MTTNNLQSGRPKIKLNARQRRNYKNSFLSVRKLTVDIVSTSGKIITPQTIRNILHDANNRGRARRKKPIYQ